MKGVILSVIIGLSSLPQSLNPLFVVQESHTPVMEMIYSSPLRLSEDGALLPYVAKLLYLKKGQAALSMAGDFYWQDGRKITLDDIAFTFNLLSSYRKTPFFPYWKGWKARVEGNRVVLRFSSFAEKYHFLFPILPKHYLQGKDPEKVLRLPSSGPFMVKEVSPAKLILVRRKFPLETAFSKITLVEVKDPAVMKMKLLSGEVDIGICSRLFLPERGFKIYKISRPAFLYLGFKGLKGGERCWFARNLNKIALEKMTEGFSRRIVSPVQMWFSMKDALHCIPEKPRTGLTLLVPSVGKERIFLAQLIQGSFPPLRIKIVAVERGMFLERLRKGNFQMVLSVFSLDFPSDLREILTCKGVANYFGYCSPDMDDAIRKRDWGRVHAIFIRDFPFVPIYQSQYPLAVKMNINWRPFIRSFSSASPFRSIIK